MNDCLFCKIIDGKIPNYSIYEDANFLAFLDINPKEEGHTLVIPKKHFELVWDVSDDLIGEYLKVCKKIANHYQKITKNKFVYSLVHGEGVPHAHIHILPSMNGELGNKITNFFDENSYTNVEKDLSQVAETYKL